MEQKYRIIIAKEFKDCVNNTIVRLQGEETYRPFHAALLSEEALFWSRFERSFSTSFGQRVVEEISKIVAFAGGAQNACRQKETIVTIDVAQAVAIDTYLNGLRDGRNHCSLSWNDALSHIRAVPLSGQMQSMRVISDLWWFKNGINHYMSIKTVKPNIDQTAVAKKDLLLLAIAEPTCQAYFGLYYNPYGENKAFYSHTPPMGIFDFRHDPCVLIGKEYWDTLGGAGCYEEVIAIANDVGRETRSTLGKLR